MSFEDSGRATRPRHIVCYGPCKDIKSRSSAGNPNIPLLAHEACHACAHEDFGSAVYWRTAVIDVCDQCANLTAAPEW